MIAGIGYSTPNTERISGGRTWMDGWMNKYIHVYICTSIHTYVRTYKILKMQRCCKLHNRLSSNFYSIKYMYTHLDLIP